MAEQDPRERVDAWLDSLPSLNTRAAYRADLAAFLAWCDANDVAPLGATGETAAAFRRDLVTGGTSEGTAKRRASAVHSFVRSLAAEATGVAPAGEQGVPEPGDGASSTVALDDGERRRLLAALPGQAPKAQVLISLLLLDGLKLDEVLRLDVGDVRGGHPRFGVDVVRDDAVEAFTLHPTTSSALQLHLADHAAGPLLPGRGDAATRLSRFGADYLVKRAGRDAGLSTPLTTNALRRTYVSHAHASGEALDDIRRRLGHDDVRTTRRYLPDPSGT
jgi:integrase